MKQIIFAAVMVTALFLVGSAQAQKSEFDLVLANGRVMDPESNLDAVRYVGIREGKIAAISLAGVPAAASFCAASIS